MDFQENLTFPVLFEILETGQFIGPWFYSSLFSLPDSNPLPCYSNMNRCVSLLLKECSFHFSVFFPGFPLPVKHQKVLMKLSLDSGGLSICELKTAEQCWNWSPAYRRAHTGRYRLTVREIQRGLQQRDTGEERASWVFSSSSTYNGVVAAERGTTDLSCEWAAKLKQSLTGLVQYGKSGKCYSRRPVSLYTHT